MVKGVTTTTTTQPAPTTRPGEVTEQFGFVRSLTAGTLVFDPAEMLIGDTVTSGNRPTCPDLQRGAF